MSDKSQDTNQAKQPYHTPRFTTYGDIHKLTNTQANPGGGQENPGCGNTCMTS